MDRETGPQMTIGEIRVDPKLPPAAPTGRGGRPSRREVLQAGLGGLAGLAGVSTIGWLGCGKRPGQGEENVAATSADVFPGDAPQGELWDQWQKQGWLTEARQKNIKNLWITCGSIQEEPLAELCGVIDAANVNLKSYNEEVYERLNAGRLAPILNTLTALKREGVWFEVTNLIVPTYTDDGEMIRRMCGWLLENLGPDYPLHFSRFRPQHKLTHLPPTPIDVLLEAREIARRSGLHYVYLGNAPQVQDGETTFCPGCKRAVIERTAFFVRSQKLAAGKCSACGTPIAGVWA